MVESENHLEPERDSSVEELRKEIQSLRASFSTALLLLIVFSFGVNFYLFRQVTILRTQELRVNAALAEWSPGGTKQVVALQTWAYFVEFAKTHPDFQPLINKYGPSFNTNQARPAAAVPAPAKK